MALDNLISVSFTTEELAEMVPVRYGVRVALLMLLVMELFIIAL